MGWCDGRHSGKAGITAQTAGILQTPHLRYPRSALGGHGGRTAAGGLLHPRRLHGRSALAVSDGGPALDRPRDRVRLLPQYGEE